MARYILNGQDLYGVNIEVDSALSPTSENPVQNKAIYSDLADKENKPTELTATLSVGATSVTFTNAAITSTAKIDVYTDTFGVNPTNQSVSGTTLTLTFKAQTAAVSVKVLVRG